MGAPSSPQAAGSGYVSSGTLAKVALNAQKQFSSFGGVMLWDAAAAQGKEFFNYFFSEADYLFIKKQTSAMMSL